MSEDGMRSARLSVAELGTIIELLDESQWEAPSACAGWRVVDVVAHLGALAHEAIDPPVFDPALPTNRERYHDVRVDERRSWSHAQVIEEWRAYTPRQLDLLETFQTGEHAEDPVEVSGLGIYPRNLLANVMAFNVFCHLHYDLLAPDGPLPLTLPEPTHVQVAPAIEFMLAGLPQMQGPELDATVTVPLVVNLTGPGATTVTVQPVECAGERLTVVPGVSGDVMICSRATDFIQWSTQRKPWREYCEITGDTSEAVQFLDCLNII